MDGQLAARVHFTADVYADLRKLLSVADVAILTDMFRAGNDGPFTVTMNGRHIASYVKIPPVKRPGDLAQTEEGAAEIEPVEAGSFPSPDGGVRRGKAKR